VTTKALTPYQRYGAVCFAAVGGMFLCWVGFSDAGKVRANPVQPQKQALGTEKAVMQCAASSLITNHEAALKQPIAAGFEKLAEALPEPKSPKYLDAAGPVRWQGPDAPLLELLDRNDVKAAMAWLQSAQPPKTGADSFHWLTLEARILAQLEQWDKARVLFQQAYDAGDESKPEWIRAAKGAPVDGAFGVAWCRAQGRAQELKAEALKEIADCEFECWGRAMAAFHYAERCMELFPKDVCLLQALPYYQRALRSNLLDQTTEASCVKGLHACVNGTTLKPTVLHDAVLKPVFHEVAAGESIHRIARKYGVEPGQIVRLNGLDASSALFVGKRLKVLPGDVHVEVDRARLTARLYIAGQLLRQYPVCIGPGDKTPSGTFTIRSKVPQPDWYYNGKRYPYGSPENILGTRWLGFDSESNGGKGASIGLHGTSKPETIPGRESLGCVRFFNGDIEEVYALLPMGAKAIVE